MRPRCRANRSHQRVSIPKGAIMRQYSEIFGMPFVSFNSKRCDYELVNVVFSKRIFAVSIPKGAIMSTLQYGTTLYDIEVSIPKGAIMSNYHHHINLALFRFNSKRCDYESLTINIRCTLLRVSIPKGAIMSALAIEQL